MRKPALMGNWKMNMDLSSATGFAGEFFKLAPDSSGEIDIVIFPPFPLIRPFFEAVKQGARWSDFVGIGAQDMHPAERGAYTGAVSGLCLKSVGATYVLIGHSERRWVFGEDDELIHAKMMAALGMTLRPVLCVGEKLESRKAGEHEDVLLSQLDKAFGDEVKNISSDISIAYEPVWAIGTGVNATPAEVGPMIDLIRKWADKSGLKGGGESIRVLYGGSVTDDNASELYAVDGIDGFLVGGASLEAFKFAAILEAMIKGKA